MLNPIELIYLFDTEILQQKLCSDLLDYILHFNFPEIEISFYASFFSSQWDCDIRTQA